MSKTIDLYIYPTCSTCKKAIAWLKLNKFEFELIDISLNPPKKEIIVDAIKQLGDRKFIFNTRGVSYRAIGAESIKKMSEFEIIEKLLGDGKLIKRPFLISSDGRILVGFNEVIWRETLLG